MPRLPAKSLIKSNLQYWMYNRLLQNGHYTNVAAGEVDFYGNDISNLVAISDHPRYADGRVFQSAFKNWTYESGVVPYETGISPPTVASGVTVDGTFYPASTTGTYAHFIDFENGTVVFDSPLVGSPVVQADFSYKTVAVLMSNNKGNENIDLIIESVLKDNPPQTGVVAYPEMNYQNVLPIIWIDFLSRDTEAYELGTRDGIKVFGGVFHLWSRDDMMHDMLEEFLADMQREVIIGVDFNTAPHPLVQNGSINPDYSTFATYANVWSPFHWRKIYLETSSPKRDKSLFEIERSRVSFEIKVYPYF